MNSPTYHAAPPHRAGPELKNKYWGEDEKNIRELFEVAPNPSEDGDFDQDSDEYGERELGILLPNNQRQHRASHAHAPKDAVPLCVCANVMCNHL